MFLKEEMELIVGAITRLIVVSPNILKIRLREQYFL